MENEMPLSAKCEMIAAGYTRVPRNCPVCKLGPCLHRDAPVYTDAQVTFDGIRNGMNEKEPNGGYVSLSIMPDQGARQPFRFKMSRAAAQSLIYDLNTALRGGSDV